MFITLYLSISPMTDKSLSLLSIPRRFLFYMTVFLYLRLNTYISNISNIYNTDHNSSLEYQTIWYHMFSYTKSDHNFHIFQLHTWIIFCFFLYVEIFYVIQRWEGVGIHCKLIPDWIKLDLARILISPCCTYASTMNPPRQKIPVTNSIPITWYKYHTNETFQSKTTNMLLDVLSKYPWDIPHLIKSSRYGFIVADFPSSI